MGLKIGSVHGWLDPRQSDIAPPSLTASLPLKNGGGATGRSRSFPYPYWVGFGHFSGAFAVVSKLQEGTTGMHRMEL